MKTIMPFIFYKLPEAFLLISSALGLLGIKINPRRIIASSLVLSAIVEIARHYFLEMGLHTPIILLAFVVILILIFHLSIIGAIIGCFLSFFLLIAGESLVATPILRLTKIPYQLTLTNPWLYLMFGWLSASFLLIATISSHIFSFSLIRIADIDNKRQRSK